ncbi:pentapeptide repeat-containing protein [Micromonospora yasonensis]|uniref:pentapeptide repeat-containing protein n=1 Tax=Micromonospora yasonensis TaxID=1128667 RepID=UPI0022329396|nr:pentapeptide repeat-containing protein [Micromonospora yasonensis]MCW3842788.1 pentapeptide repeat-containing protein [Micromonospora yasonensis]
MRITDTMYAFLSGESERLKVDASAQLAAQWGLFDPGALAPTLALLWSARYTDWTGTPDQLLAELIGPHGVLDHCRFERWQVANGVEGAMARSFRAAVLVECNFVGMDLRGSRFDGAWLESIDFSSADLRDVDFTGASLLDVDLTDASLAGANFRNAEEGLYVKESGREFTGSRAMGLLQYRGAYTPEVPNIFVAMAHPHYEIARKIARRLSEGGQSQLLGLTQRGVSQKEPAAAQRFVDLLVSVGFASYDRSGASRTLEPTVAGRLPLRQLSEETNLDNAFRAYFGLSKLAIGTS